MFGLLHQYLIENRSLYLQGTGHLQIIQQPAGYDVANQILLAPQQAIQLNTAAPPSGLQPLMAFISRQLSVAEETAYSLYEGFCQQLHQSVSEGHNFEWENLGSFKIDDSGEKLFIPDPLLESLNEPVPARRVIRKNGVHPLIVGGRETTSTEMQELLSEPEVETKKDRWWVGALVLGIAAIVLIVLKKMQVL